MSCSPSLLITSIMALMDWMTLSKCPPALKAAATLAMLMLWYFVARTFSEE